RLRGSGTKHSWKEATAKTTSTQEWTLGPYSNTNPRSNAPANQTKSPKWMLGYMMLIVGLRSVEVAFITTFKYQVHVRTPTKIRKSLVLYFQLEF
ncbi:unnamed protein product, partial [Ilex paraguariensis]